MFDKRTSVGLDVHARSVSGAAIDSVTGEVFRRELGADPVEVLSWLAGLPGPVAAVYEAGPTGYGLCRALREAEVSCEVVAPSKVLRPAGDRVKTAATRCCWRGCCWWAMCRRWRYRPLGRRRPVTWCGRGRPPAGT